MIKLRRKIVVWFLVITFAAGILNAVVDGVFDIFMQSFEPDEAHILISAAVVLLISIVIFVMSGVVFYLIVKKAVQEESERQVREKDLIYAAVAHDLKTPMTSVQGFAKALSDGKILPEDQQETFDLIYRKSNSMNEMVNTLFEYAKLGTDKYKPVMSQVNICSLVRDVVAENYCDFEEHGIEPEIDIPDDEIVVQGDKNELKRAVTNLAVNVYKHNPDGITAKISVYEENGKAVIRIADSGSEIPTEMDIFEPFVTENASRTPGQGTGLGLAVTKRIIERFGGRIYTAPCSDGFTKAFVIEFREI